MVVHVRGRVASSLNCENMSGVHLNVLALLVYVCMFEHHHSYKLS